MDELAVRLRHGAHLVARFMSSLVPRQPSPGSVERVTNILTPAEFAVWSAMPRADRVESVATMRRLPTAVASDDRYAAAALLHDAGKQLSRLGTGRRAGATAWAAIVGPAAVRGRSRTYLRHPELGAELLAASGARPEAVAWAAAHHAPERWPTDLLPEPVCAALARADGEPNRSEGRAAACR